MQYKVNCNETQYGSKLIEAESGEEAMQLANQYIEEHGIDHTFKVCGREFNTVYAEEIDDERS